MCLLQLQVALHLPEATVFNQPVITVSQRDIVRMDDCEANFIGFVVPSMLSTSTGHEVNSSSVLLS